MAAPFPARCLMCSCSPHGPDCSSHPLQFPPGPGCPRFLLQCWVGLSQTVNPTRAQTGKISLTANIPSAPTQQLFQDVFQLFWTSIYSLRKGNSSVFLSEVNTVHLGWQYYINKDSLLSIHHKSGFSVQYFWRQCKVASISGFTKGFFSKFRF